MTHRSHECGSGHRGQRPDDRRRVRVARRSASPPHSGDTRAGSSDGERSRKRGYLLATSRDDDTRSHASADLQPLHRRALPSADGRPEITPWPGHARAAATAHRARLAQQGRVVRHGGARGLRTDRTAVAGAGVATLDVAVDEIPRISPKDPGQRAVAARGDRRRADRTRAADTGGGGRARQRARARIVSVPQANRATGEGHRRARGPAARSAWWRRWPPTWASNPPSSTRRSTTTEPRPGRSAQMMPRLRRRRFTLGQAAPDAEALVVRRGVVEAPVLRPRSPSRSAWPRASSRPSRGRTPRGRSARTARAPAIARHRRQLPARVQISRLVGHQRSTAGRPGRPTLCRSGIGVTGVAY